MGILFLLAGFLHIYYNWNPIILYLKTRARKIRIFTANFNIALAVTMAVGVGTYFMVPPMSTIIRIGESIKDQAAAKYGEPPYGHAELSSLRIFTKRTGLDLEKGKELLAGAGIGFEGEEQTMLDIAGSNELTPKQLYEVLKEARTADSGDAFPSSPPPGFGRRSLAEVCAEFQLHPPTVIRGLAEKGIQAESAQIIQEIAAANQVSPMTVFEALQEVANNGEK
jgi:hypothetical protein